MLLAASREKARTVDLIFFVEYINVFDNTTRKSFRSALSSVFPKRIEFSILAKIPIIIRISPTKIGSMG